MQLETAAQLNDLIDDVLSRFGDETITIPQVANKCLRKARIILEKQRDQFVIRVLKPLIHRRIGKPPGSGEATQIPLLRGLEDLKVPYRIAVPNSPEGDDDPEGQAADWVVLHLATCRQLRKNIDLRNRLIRGAEEERDKIWAIYQAMLDAGAHELDVVADVLGNIPKAA